MKNTNQEQLFLKPQQPSENSFSMKNSLIPNSQRKNTETQFPLFFIPEQLAHFIENPNILIEFYNQIEISYIQNHGNFENTNLFFQKLKQEKQQYDHKHTLPDLNHDFSQNSLSHFFTFSHSLFYKL